MIKTKLALYTALSLNFLFTIWIVLGVGNIYILNYSLPVWGRTGSHIFLNESTSTAFYLFILFFSIITILRYTILLPIAPFYAQRKANFAKNRYKPINVNPLISVIIPVKNEEVGIYKTLASLAACTYKPIEIIVINDGSTDNTALLLKAAQEKIEFPKGITFKYIDQDNTGKAGALNAGIKISSGEVIMTIDGDCKLDMNALANVVKYFSNPNISAVAGNIRIANKKAIVAIAQDIEYIATFYGKRAYSVIGTEYVLGGACASFRREVFDQVGYFDTNHKTEDIELTLRLRESGLYTMYGDDVICWTEGAETFDSLVKQRTRWNFGKLVTFKRYKKLFFSRNIRHNRLLSWLILPLACATMLTNVLDVLFAPFLLAYTIIVQDYRPLFIVLCINFLLYLLVITVEDFKHSVRLLIRYPFTWMFSYITNMAEAISVVKALILIKKNEEVSWQKWKRVGI